MDAFAYVQGLGGRAAGMKTPRFWKALEDIGAKTSSLKDFQDRIGTVEYAVVGRYITPVKSQDGVIPTVIGYPCDKCQRMHTVEEAGDDKFFAYLDGLRNDDEAEISCPDIKGLTLDQVRKRHLDVTALVAALVDGFTLKAEFLQRGPGLFLIGTTHDRRAPVFLSIKGDDAGYIRDANAVKGDTVRPFILFTVTPHACVAARFGRDGAYTFALADVVTFDGSGVMKVVASAERLMAQGLPAASVLPVKGSVLALKGKRYQLADDFSWIENRKTKKRYNTRPLCREAFRVLVECGAGSQETALTKVEFCEAVYRRAKPDGVLPKDPKPVQFFREFTSGSTVLLPYYKDVIRSLGDGRYWLNL